MKNALVLLKESLDSLSPSEKAVAKYLLHNYRECQLESIHEIAKNTYVSTASIIRLCKKLGFKGFKDFKESLIRYVAIEKQNHINVENDLTVSDSIEEVVHKITYRNIQALHDSLLIIPIESLQEAINMIVNADQILLFGIGASYLSCVDLHSKLIRINKKCVLNEDYHLQLITAINSSDNDVAIVFSYSGNTPEIIKCMNTLRENNTPIIAITRCVESKASKLADCLLYVTSNENLYRVGAMASRISSLNIVDILFSALLNATHEQSMDTLAKTYIIK